ncbi:hypothetical protein H4R19_000303 [Coemansia spiralis]|nr:hypothetical protein H4R19_000303 [Coemansia spiralis]
MKNVATVTHEHDGRGNITGYQIHANWQHNLDLIVGSGCQRFARRLVISDVRPADFLERLRLLQQVIGQNIIDWSRISGLYIQITGDYSGRGADADSDDLQQAAAYAQQFVSCLPSVRRMVGVSGPRVMVYKTFIRELYTHYAPQLHAFWTESLHRPVNLRFGHELTSLVITGKCLKRLGERAIYAPALKHLIIRQASYRQLLWAAFYDDGGSSNKTLAFQSLAHLKLEYCYEHPQTARSLNVTIPAFPKQLLFPKLQKLEVTGFLLNCPVMFHAQLPSRLWLMVLKCPVRVARVLASRTLPTALDISCNIAYDYVDKDSSPVKAVNALLGAIRATERLSVNYSAQEANCWADMEWNSVTSLRTNCPMTANDIMLILTKIPRVQSLIVTNLCVSGLELDDVIEAFNNHPDANPHDVSVRELHLFRCDGEKSPYDYLRFAQILRTTFPGLRLVTVDNKTLGS